MAIKYASIIFCLNLLVGALQIIDQVKESSKWLLMCFDGFDLSDGVLCSSHLNSTLRIVSAMNVSPLIKSSFINYTSWMDTRIFKFKKSFYFSSEPFLF